MINLPSIKQKIQLLALAIPVFADDDTALYFIPTKEFEKVALATPDSFISGAINTSLIISIIVFFFILVMGGIKWTTSSGDEKKLTSARSQIINSIIGLFFILSSYAILGLIEHFFDIEIIKGLHIPSLKIPTD